MTLDAVTCNAELSWLGNIIIESNTRLDCTLKSKYTYRNTSGSGPIKTYYLRLISITKIAAPATALTELEKKFSPINILSVQSIIG